MKIVKLQLGSIYIMFKSHNSRFLCNKMPALVIFIAGIKHVIYNMMNGYTVIYTLPYELFG